MTPSEVQLPCVFGSTKNSEEPPQAQRPPTIPRPLQSISGAELDKLCSSKRVTSVNGCRVVGAPSDYPDISDIPLKVCCRCVRLELAKDADRNRYGDLIANSLTNGGIEVTWEERVTEPCGLVVYLTYLEYIRVLEQSNEKDSI